MLVPIYKGRRPGIAVCELTCIQVLVPLPAVRVPANRVGWALSSDWQFVEIRHCREDTQSCSVFSTCSILWNNRSWDGFGRNCTDSEIIFTVQLLIWMYGCSYIIWWLHSLSSMKFFMEGSIMTHFSLVVQEWEWHLYPGGTTGCC